MTKHILSIVFLLATFQLKAIDATFTLNDQLVVFVQGDKVVKYNFSEQRVVSAGVLTQNGLPGVNFKQIDAAVNFGNGKVYLFSGSQYVRFDLTSFAADPGYPKSTQQYWPGINFSKIDAAMNWPNKSYFFAGDQYARFDAKANQADEGYPKKTTSSTWPGLTFAKIDAAFTQNGITYFFAGEKYTAYDVTTDKALAGYPKNLKDLTPLWSALNEVKPEVNTVATINSGNYSYHSVSKQEVSVAPYKLQAPNSVLADFMAAAGKYIYLGFQQKDDAIIYKLKSNGEQVGEAIVLNDYWLSKILPLADGTLLVAAGKSNNNTYIEGYPNTLYLMKYDPSGKREFVQEIFGGEGHGPGKSWFDGRSEARLAYNGYEIGLYFEVQKNFAKVGEDIHNGDMFVVTDMNGNIKEDRTHFWTASHSSTVNTFAAASGEFYTMTIGDAHPYGLQIYNRNTSKSFVPYPPEEDYVPYEKVESTCAAGILEFCDEANGNLIAVLGSTEHPNVGVFTKVDPLFLVIDKNDGVIAKKWLEVSPETDESNISVHPLGEHYLIAWGAGNDYDNDWKAGNVEIAIVDANGDFVVKPVEIDAPFGMDSEIFPISETEFGWFEQTLNGSDFVNFYKVNFTKNPAP